MKNKPLLTIVIPVLNGEKYIAARKEMLDQPNELETICHTCKKNGYDLS